MVFFLIMYTYLYLLIFLCTFVFQFFSILEIKIILLFQS